MSITSIIKIPELAEVPSSKKQIAKLIENNKIAIVTTIKDNKPNISIVRAKVVEGQIFIEGASEKTKEDIKNKSSISIITLNPEENKYQIDGMANIEERIVITPLDTKEIV